MAEVSLNAVGFRYPGAGENTLSGLDLTVAHGSTHALLGASGAGKTTLLNLLSGLLHPTSGSISFNGTDVSSCSPRERNVALVFQFPVLYETQSVLDNLMFPLLNRGWRHSDAESRAREVAEELEIEKALSKKPADLSLFEKQLTAIGKSLVRTDVDLVLLDEPLTAVEPAKKWHLRQTLLRFQKAHGLTMIYVTHDQTEALTFASQVSVLADGEILQTATPEEIYNRPANRFVGDFIGAPGMRFLPRVTSNGLEKILDLEWSMPKEALDTDWVGFRAEWLLASRTQEGAWTVLDTSLEGTYRGEPKHLLTLRQNDLELMSVAYGDWHPGDRATLQARQCVGVNDQVVRDTGSLGDGHAQ